jgi:dTDP-4-dehydrorhamnose reductase
VNKYLITGARGLLGSNIIRVLKSIPGISIHGTDLHLPAPDSSVEFHTGDLLDASFIPGFIKSIKPDVIINTVALPDVDRCEREPALAGKLNISTALKVAEAARLNGSRLIHISTDQLFKGEKSFSSEDNAPQPINVYARTKLEAENAVLKTTKNAVVVRTNFYGCSPAGHARTFGEWLYYSLKDKTPIKLFTDYFYTPIEVTYFVKALLCVAQSEFCGILNVAGKERCSKYDFGIAMAHEFGFATDNVEAAEDVQHSGRALRPKDISLSTEKFRKTFDFELPDVKIGLKEFKKQLEKSSGK